EIGRRASAPVVASAAPSVVGLGSFLELGSSSARDRIDDACSGPKWRALRASDSARHLVLCAPRILLRLPYGPNGDAVEAFPCDAGLRVAEHESFLWGSSALALGCVLGESPCDGGGLSVPPAATLSGLPLHIFHDKRDPSRALPCAEVVMSDATVEALADAGIVPRASYRERDIARFARIQTVAGTRLPTST